MCLTYKGDDLLCKSTWDYKYMYTCVLSVDIVNFSLCHHLGNKCHVSIKGETADELKTYVDKLPKNGVNPELRLTQE